MTDPYRIALRPDADGNERVLDPTVDDLLAWLRNQGWSLMTAWWDDDFAGYLVELARNGHFAYESDDGHKTLLAALEAAVRHAVAP